MRAAFHHAAGFQHVDRIGMAHRGQAMRHDQCGALVRDARQRTLDRRFGLVVHRGGCLVEHEHGGIAIQGARQGNALALAAGQ